MANRGPIIHTPDLRNYASGVNPVTTKGEVILSGKLLGLDWISL